MKLLILSRYDRRGASSRLRMLDFIPALETAGFQITRQHLFDKKYISALYSGRRSTRAAARAYFKRLWCLLRLSKYDVIWIEKEALPWLPAWVERKFFGRKGVLVTDYDDAVFHRYDLHRSALVRRLLGHKIETIMKSSDMVFAGNAYLLDYATRAGAHHIEIVPTVVDVDKYSAAEPRLVLEGSLTIGWMGTPGTWDECVTPFVPLFEDTLTQNDLRFLIIGGGDRPELSSRFERRAWSEDREVADIQEMDIGVMPLPNTPWMQGKCGYKLIQYMACGLPVVASPVGVNTEIVEHGVNGFLAETSGEWKIALTSLINDPELRQRMGCEGRKKVEANYSLQIQGPRVARLLRDVGERGHA